MKNMSLNIIDPNTISHNIISNNKVAVQEVLLQLEVLQEDMVVAIVKVRQTVNPLVLDLAHSKPVIRQVQHTRVVIPT
jgi:hypothetical protein